MTGHHSLISTGCETHSSERNNHQNKIFVHMPVQEIPFQNMVLISSFGSILNAEPLPSKKPCSAIR
jgi:hypothetical protein